MCFELELSMNRLYAVMAALIVSSYQSLRSVSALDDWS